MVHNRVQLICIPGHEETDGNEIADQLAKLGCEHPLIRPELAGASPWELPR
jgi:ribonuclease HI